MDKIKNITKIIVNILCVILFLILALVIYAKVVVTISDDIHANYFGYRILEVASGSMQPTLDLNDVLLVKVNEKDLKQDDIIAYKTEESIITHRIVMINNDDLIVKGDANNTVDSPIKKDQVIGKVVKVFPHLGIWKKVLTEPKILALIFFTLLMFDAALSYNGKDKKKSDLKVKKIKSKEEKKKKDSIDISKEELLSNINKLLEQDEDLSKVKVKRKKGKQKNKKTKKETEYTIRLDLNEIQNEINKTVK